MKVEIKETSLLAPRHSPTPLLLPVGAHLTRKPSGDDLAVTLAPVPAPLLVDEVEELSGVLVMRWMNRISPYNDWVSWYGEISDAIASAAEKDPLWAPPMGPVTTAALLTALAFTTSHFEPNRIGFSGQAFGLFQIRSAGPETDATVFQLPRSACFAAIEILRALDRGQAEEEEKLRKMLSWYDEGWLPPFAAQANVGARLDLARFLLTDGGRLT